MHREVCEVLEMHSWEVLYLNYTFARWPHMMASHNYFMYWLRLTVLLTNDLCASWISTTKSPCEDKLNTIFAYGTVHMLYLTRGARMFQRGQRNNHACTYKFTHLQIKHAWFLHELFSRLCHIFLSLIGVRVKTSNTVL